MKRHAIRHGAVVTALTACLAGTGTTLAHADTDASPSATHATKAKWGEQWNRVVHVRSLGSSCGKKVIAEASGGGGTTLRIDQTKTVGTSLSKNISATYKAITYSVGWDVSKSRSITVSGARPVPKGKHGVLKAYVRYSGKKFDVQSPDLSFAGGPRPMIIQKNKKAYRPIGACFKFSAK